MCYIHTETHTQYFILKKEGTLSFATTWTHQEGIMINEIDRER